MARTPYDVESTVSLIKEIEGELTSAFGMGQLKGQTHHNVGLFKKAEVFGVKPQVRGDEQLIKKLMNAAPVLARHFRAERGKLVKKVVVPAIKKFVPRSRRKFRKAGHLRASVRVVSSTLERVLIVAGNPKVWWGGIVHARWMPFFPYGLFTVREKFYTAHQKMLDDFMAWLADSRFSRPAYSKSKFKKTLGKGISGLNLLGRRYR